MIIIYAPDNKPESKCWQVFDPVMNGGWPDSDISVVSNTSSGFMYTSDCMMWGFVGQNESIYRRTLETHSVFSSAPTCNVYFTDMPYFGRYSATNPDAECYWRMIPNALHVNHQDSRLPDDRWKAHGIELQDWKTNGDHILLCPSSETMTRHVYGYGVGDWILRTMATLSTHTDRPIHVRYKPRGNGTSGPDAATIPLEDDLKNCHAVVTGMSIAAVQAVVAGVPVFSHDDAPTAPVGLTNLSGIEAPRYPDRQPWLNTLCHYQYTPAEIKSGMAYEFLQQSLDRSIKYGILPS